MFEKVRSINDVNVFFDELDTIVPEFEAISFYQYDHHYSFARIQRVGSVGIKLTLAFHGAETTVLRKTTPKGLEVIVRGHILLGDYIYSIEDDTQIDQLDDLLKNELWRTLCVLQDVINNSEVDI